MGRGRSERWAGAQVTGLHLTVCVLFVGLASSACAETKDRTDPHAMRARIQPAADLAASGHYREAEATFAEVLARNQRDPNHLKVDQLDLISAFGVALCGSTQPARSLPYLRRAVALSKTTFGPDHPETALAYTDLGDCLRRDPTQYAGAERRDAYRLAYRIRLASLGADNEETLAASDNLARFPGPAPTPPSVSPAATPAVEAETLKVGGKGSGRLSPDFEMTAAAPAVWGWLWRGLLAAVLVPVLAAAWSASRAAMRRFGKQVAG